MMFDWLRKAAPESRKPPVTGNDIIAAIGRAKMDADKPTCVRMSSDTESILRREFAGRMGRDMSDMPPFATYEGLRVEIDNDMPHGEVVAE